MAFLCALEGWGFGEGGYGALGDVDPGVGVKGQYVLAEEASGLGEDGVGGAEFGGAVEGREVDGFLEDGGFPGHYHGGI